MIIRWSSIGYSLLAEVFTERSRTAARVVARMPNSPANVFRQIFPDDHEPMSIEAETEVCKCLVLMEHIHGIG